MYDFVILLIVELAHFMIILWRLISLTLLSTYLLILVYNLNIHLVMLQEFGVTQEAIGGLYKHGHELLGLLEDVTALEC